LTLGEGQDAIRLVGKRGLYLSLLALGALASCSSEDPPALKATPPAPKAKQVLFIGLDGARPDAVQKAHTPALDRLAAEGAWTYAARTQQKAPTKSAPGWQSILAGVDADKHLMVANDGYEKRDTRYPSFLWRAQQAGFPVFLAPAWIGIIQLTESEQLKKSQWAPDGLATKFTVEALKSSDYRVFFIHYDAIDITGHTSGFSQDNPAYIQAIEKVDVQIQTLLDTIQQRPTYAQEDWLIAATTDHGGEGLDHGPQDDANQTIWMMLHGPGVQKGQLPQARQVDVHPTVLRFLGVPITSEMGLDGSVIGLP
jgi:predicted AlkP superfamily pyrophosphatase or phosphodiesterase